MEEPGYILASEPFRVMGSLLIKDLQFSYCTSFRSTTIKRLLTKFFCVFGLSNWSSQRELSSYLCRTRRSVVAGIRRNVLATMYIPNGLRFFLDSNHQSWREYNPHSERQNHDRVMNFVGWYTYQETVRLHEPGSVIHIALQSPNKHLGHYGNHASYTICIPR